MSVWIGPYYVVAVLLAVAGLAKVADPQATVGALRGMGLPLPSGAVRFGGAIEAIVGIGAIVTGSAAFAVAVAASYLLFGAFVIVARVRRLPIGSCGCFGRVDTPPSVLHLVVNAAAVLVAAVVAVQGSATIGEVMADQPLAGVPFFALVFVGMYAAFTALTVVPQLMILTADRRP